MNIMPNGGVAEMSFMTKGDRLTEDKIALLKHNFKQLFPSSYIPEPESCELKWEGKTMLLPKSEIEFFEINEKDEHYYGTLWYDMLEDQLRCFVGSHDISND